MPWQDDPTISDDAVLWRRVPHSGGMVTWDPVTGEPTASTQNFNDANDELSLFISTETTLSALLAGEKHACFGVIAITASDIRAVLSSLPDRDLAFVRDDVPGEPGHVIIRGLLTPSQRKQLKKRATWVQFPVRPA